VQSAPQALQAVQAVLLQPGLEFAVGLHFFLQRTQGFQPRRQIGLPGRFGVDGLLRGTARVVELRHAVLQFLQARVGDFVVLLRAGELRLQVQQALLVGRGQGVPVGAQLLAPRAELARLLLDAALLGCQHLDLLLHLGHRRALLAGPGLRLAQRVFQFGQRALLLFELCRQRDGLLFGLGALRDDRLDLAFSLVLARGPLGDLLLELQQPCLSALAAFDDEADLGLQPADLGAGLVQQALSLIHLVAGGVVRLADGFQVGLDMAQIGHARFELVDGLLGLLLEPDLTLLGFRALEEPQLVLLQRRPRLQVVVALRHLGLALQLVQVGVQLAQDVLDASQVLARVVEPVLGLAPALLVLADAGRLFQEQAQLLGARLDDAADGALADDGVGTRPQAGAEEHVLHVAPAHRLVVDVVTAGAVARQHALDRDLGELAPLAAGAVIAVVEHQLDRRAAGRLARGGAVEDDVLHRLAAQLGRLGLAQHPAHRIHDVGLAAAVGPHDADQLARQHEVGGFGEGLEARELDRIETHWRGGPQAGKTGTDAKRE